MCSQQSVCAHMMRADHGHCKLFDFCLVLFYGLLSLLSFSHPILAFTLRSFSAKHRFCESVGHVAKCDGSPSGGGKPNSFTLSVLIGTSGYTYKLSQ